MPLPNPVFDSMVLLADCLCTQIMVCGGPDVCFCGVVPGESVVADYGGDCAKKCGMAWVRLNALYPSTSMGEPNNDPKNCRAGLGYEVELGILRCTPVGTGDIPPTQDQLLNVTELQVHDAMTMRRAVACCDGSDDWSMGTYGTVGPTGGILGGSWLVTMWVP
jgi:hypothetical protein